MTQEEVYMALEKLGGTASTKEISEKAKELFPKCSLWSYVGFVLRKLEKNGYVERVPNPNSREIKWKIISEIQ